MEAPTMTACDDCEAEMTEALYDASEGLCDACMRKRFVCQGCEELTLKTEAHPTHGTLCQDCGESRAEELRQEAFDAAAEELRDLVESIIDREDLDAVRRALASLKKPQSK
jgi:hypothetical protein